MLASRLMPTAGTPPEAIRAAIRERGPIGFDEFMEIALYGSGGYYEEPPVGPRGDFVTSPHVHTVFGTMLARGIRELWELLDRPAPMRIAEVGAGDGTLARRILAELHDLSLDYLAVDVSSGARVKLSEIGDIRVVTTLEGAPHLVLANELLDNLPFRIRRGSNEIRVGLDGERFVEVEVPGDFDDEMPDGVIPSGALAFVDQLGAGLANGYALLIDYGDVGSTGGEIHGYRNHHVVADVLANPGSTDITAGVDFALLARRAERTGLTAYPTVTQRDALFALGFGDWMHDELRHQAELLDEREGLEAVRAWSGRSRATLLANPAALGRLRWLLLATPGLPRPSWLP